MATMSQLADETRNPLQPMQALRAALFHASGSHYCCRHQACHRASMIDVVAAVRSANLDKSSVIATYTYRYSISIDKLLHALRACDYLPDAARRKLQQ